jgi:hypothetical protein
MAALDSAVNAYAGEIAAIGLSKSSSAAGEVTGGGYERLTPTYTTSTGGAASADLTGALEFDGPANDGPITHAIIEYDDATTRVVALTESVSFNSDGRLNLTSAEVTGSHGS